MLNLDFVLFRPSVEDILPLSLGSKLVEDQARLTLVVFIVSPGVIDSGAVTLRTPSFAR